MIYKLARTYSMLFILGICCCYSQNKETEEEIARQITATGLAVREAFKNGDIATIKLYHHPEVVKALSYNNLKVGRDAVLEGLRETISNYDLEFSDDKKEELFLHKGDLIIKQMLFGLRLIPKNGDKPFVFRGRTLVILQRHSESPSGWATIYEIIQPYEEHLN